MTRLVLVALVLGLSFFGAGCGEDPPPPPPTTTAPPPPLAPEPPPVSPCEALCDRAASCDLDLGSRPACMRRCQLRAPRDVEMLDCLAEPAPEGERRCDLARRCTEVWVERQARPTAVIPEDERLDVRALGPELQISLESRLLDATTESSHYDLVLLVRGRGQWDGGVGEEDAGVALDGGEFDGGLQAPDLWVRLGAYTSDGRLPLLRIDPRSAGEDGQGPLFQQSSFWAGTGDSYRVRHVRDELVIEHAFLQSGASRAEEIESDFEPRLRIQLAPGARVTALRELVP